MYSVRKLTSSMDAIIIITIIITTTISNVP